MIEVGTVLNNTFLIQEQIGAGGGGVVFKAHHLRLDTDVVVKQIRDEVKDKIHTRQEADILKQLKHPSLPRVYDFIETDEGVYTVMDFISGVSLDKILSSRRLTQFEVIKWGRQLADALAYLHTQNPPIIHSDIKPANIIIDPNGDATLIDFNVSIMFDDRAKYSVGISLGYAPPEQYRDIDTYKRVTNIQNLQGTYTEELFSKLTGDLANGQKTAYLMPKEDDDKTLLLRDDKTLMLKNQMCIDVRSDVYSLGAVLYHMITGAAPKLDFNAIVPLSKLNYTISEGLAVIVDKMMALSPAERYQSGKDVLYAFTNIYKLDRRYIGLKRKEKAVGAFGAILLIAGAGLLGLGYRQSIIEADAYYENEILTADNYAEDFYFDKAIDVVKELEEDSPSKLKAYEREAYYLYAAGRYDEAQERIEEIFADQLVVESKYNTDDVIGNLYGIMGNCSYELGDYVNAKGYIETSIGYIPENPTYYRDYAISLAKLGDFEIAQKAVERAAKLGMDETSMSYVNAEIESAKGNTSEALAILEPLIENCTDADIYNRAVLLAANDYVEINDYNNALEMFNKIYESGVTTYQVQENIAYLYSQMGQLDKTEEILLGLADEYPNNYRVYKRLAVLEVKKQDQKANSSRDYHKMQEYYNKAFELYENAHVEDSEMDVLKAQMQNVIDGGWL